MEKKIIRKSKRLAKKIEKEIDTTKKELKQLPASPHIKKQFGLFDSISVKELSSILGLTIKKDKSNKLITFLCQLSAYTETSQFNISYNAPSSTGKSYIPTEIAKLFPKEDVIEVGYCSPTAFFHDRGEFNKELSGYIVDLSRKILIFLDQPHTLLLQHLRPFLSHDKKELHLKITDKSQKQGLRTKNIILKGFPAVIFCSAGLKIDEQESTRFLLLSPEISQSKIRAAIKARVIKEADSSKYDLWLAVDERRELLKLRIEAIKDQQIKDVRIPQVDDIIKRFLSQNKFLKPRHSRDISRILSLIKAFVLLNLWSRDNEEDVIIASQEDVDVAFDIWDEIAQSQEFNLSPYIFQLFEKVIKPAYEEKNSELENGGITRNEVIQKHFKVYGRPLPDWQLRQQIIPMLDTAGLIIQEPDPEDKRRMLIYPTTPLTISLEENSEKNNSELGGGVDNTKL